MKKPAKQPSNSGKVYEHLAAWQFKPGQSGNPSGRPKGTVSLKEYAKRYLQDLSEEEKMEFMAGLGKDVIWKMAEGNPKNDMELSATINMSKVLDEVENGPAISRQAVESEPAIQNPEQESPIGEIPEEQSTGALQPEQMDAQHHPEV